MNKLYIDPGYTNVGWANTSGDSGHLELTGSEWERIQQLRSWLIQHVSTDPEITITVESYNTRSSKTTGSKTLLIIGAILAIAPTAELIDNASWRSQLKKTLERNYSDVTARREFLEIFNEIKNVHERDAAKIRYSLSGICPILTWENKK